MSGRGGSIAFLAVPMILVGLADVAGAPRAAALPASAGATPAFVSPLGATAPAGSSQQQWVPDYGRRDEWQQPERILDAMGIEEGMRIADVGAGGGYFTFRLAERVGPDGRVYAEDIREDSLREIEERAEREDIGNVVTVLGTPEDPRLPPGQVDMVLMVHVLHLVMHDQDPFALLESIKACLKPGGVLVLVQWDGVKMGAPNVRAYSQELLVETIGQSSFEIFRTETFLPRDNIYFLRPR